MSESFCDFFSRKISKVFFHVQNRCLKKFLQFCKILKSLLYEQYHFQEKGSKNIFTRTLNRNPFSYLRVQSSVSPWGFRNNSPSVASLDLFKVDLKVTRDKLLLNSFISMSWKNNAALNLAARQNYAFKTFFHLGTHTSASSQILNLKHSRYTILFENPRWHFKQV